LENIVQIEIPIVDLKRALEFYEAVFGWKLAPTEIHNYYVLDVPKTMKFGVALICVPEFKPSTHQTTVYFECPEIEYVLEKVVERKGKITMGPKEVPPYGVIHHFTDPDGNRWGLFSEK
jgi:predicted enzyme related to lactoylglutathione lyase